METTITISDRKITNRRTFGEWLIALEDGRYIVKVQPIKHRSNNQNRYYWGIVVPMVKDGLRDAGYNDVKTNDDAHEILKHLFLKRKIGSEKTGDEIIISGSTSKLKTYDFNIYLEEIWQWAAEYLSISIPAPNEQMEIFNQ